ncbi:uncharacterized protein C8Q71DRAFT_712593, partial [Rhodofomes roseus]
MLGVAKKHGVSLEAIKLSRTLKRSLPVWYHLGAEAKLRRLNNTSLSDCLRRTHGIKTVADALDFTMHTAIVDGLAPPETACTCTDCTEARSKGCKNPEKCRLACNTILNQIKPKWDPLLTTHNDGLTLTARRKEENHTAETTAGALMIFNPSVTSSDSVSATFRAFVSATAHDAPPAIRRRAGIIVTDEATTAY